MHIKKSFLIFVLLLSCFTVFGLSSVREILPELSDSDYEKIMRGESVESLTTTGDSTSELAPYGSIAWNMARDTENLDYAFSVSVLNFIPYPESFKNMTKEEKYIELFNIMQKISTIVGVEYDSQSSNGKGEVLFKEASMLSAPDARKKIEDPVYTSVPNRVSSYAYLKDSRFGGNVYKLEYYAYNDEIFMEITNVKDIKYMGFTCVKANSLHMYIDATMTEEGILVYGLSVVYNQEPTVKVLFVTVDLPSAFLKRIESLGTWFIDSVGY
ncbi:MAG: hypothetical protein K5634_00410 [Sphaerochaetaceae bacterium]|nr:hypothetical protein [Sphaerochaetaceae bacterium]